MAPASYASPRSPNPSFRSGARAAVYRPPQSPAIASPMVSSRTDHDRMAATVSGSRKRSRGDDADGRTNALSHQSSRADSWTSSSSIALSKTQSTGSARTESPPPFVNTRYRLANGLESPTSASTDAISYPFEDDFRKTWSNPKAEYQHAEYTVRAGALARERNGGRKRQRSEMEEQPGETWSQYVYQMVGGLAGRVWDFCRTSASTFRGFTAGPGTAYTVSPSTTGRDETPQGWVKVDAASALRRARGSTPVPGEFPEEEIEEDDIRPAKRQQVSQLGDWVVVDHHKPSPTTQHQRASPSQRSLLPRPVASRSASLKQTRPSTARLTQVSHSGSPQLGHTRSASSASVRTTPSSKPQQERSPASADIQKYAAKREREERLQDASMKKLNQQLKAMIKEGKQALATKIEVEDEFMRDEDFV